MNRISFLILLLCAGCQVKNQQTIIHISLISNKHSLKITGINPFIMHDINRDTSSNWQSLFPVFKMPADTGMKNYQSAQPGLYQLRDSALIFTPDTPFTKQQVYFVRYYNYAGDDSVWDYIKGNKRLGKLHFTDLVFKQ